MKEAIESRWECPSCGNIIRKREVLTTLAGSKKFTQPNKCGCGRTGSFTLMGFEERNYVIYNESEVNPLMVPIKLVETMYELMLVKIKELKIEEEKNED